MLANWQEQFKEFGIALAEAFTKIKDKEIDDYCDKNNVNDEDREEFKKVNKIKVYCY